MKIVKIILKTVVVLAALVVVALLALPLWFGPVAKTAANAVVPGVVKTDFHLGHLSLNPYTARFELGDMQLANPTGYSEKFAVTVGDVNFDAETLSLMTDVIHIEEIKVKDVFVSYVNGGENKVNNFQQIQYNVAGGKDKYEAAQAEKKAAEAEQKPVERKAEAKSDKSAKKVIIDRIEISGVMVQLGFMPLPVPSLTLTDIGRKTGGATLSEVWQQVYEAVLKSAGVAGEQLKALGALTGDAAKQATAAASKAASQATEAAGKAASQATEAAAKLTGSVSDVTGSATKSVGKATEGATKAVGNAADAATEAAGKALDSIKSLW